MTPHDAYRIPGTEQHPPRQLNEHARVEQRSNIAIFISAVAAVAAILAAFFSYHQAHIAAESLELTTKIVKGTEAAFLESTFSPLLNEGIIDVGFQNTGKVIASDFSAVLVVSRKELPGYTNIGNPQTIRIERSQVPPMKPSAGQTVAIQDYSQDDLTRIEHMNEIISVEGSFRYDNGFGDVIRQSVCLLYVDLRNSHSGSSGFMHCEDAKSAIYRASKR